MHLTMYDPSLHFRTSAVQRPFSAVICLSLLSPFYWALYGCSSIAVCLSPDVRTMQRATVSASPVEEEDWRNGHVAQHPKSSPPQTTAPPTRAPSLPTSFPLPPLLPPAGTDHEPLTAAKQEDAPTEPSHSRLPPQHPTHTNGSHPLPSTSIADSAPQPYLIYSLPSPSDPVGVVDCSPLSSLSSLRHLLLDELVSELSSTSFVFLYRGVKLTERQEQVKTVSNIAQRVDGTQADEAVYIRYTHTAAADPSYPSLSSSALYPLPPGLPPLVSAGSSVVSSSTRLSFDQLSYLELLKLRDASKQPNAAAVGSGAEAGPPKKKRGRPPKRRFDDNGMEITDSSKRERLSAPPILQLNQPHIDSHPPLIPPPPPAAAVDTSTLGPATQRSVIDTSELTGSPPSSLALLPLLGSPTASMPGSPKRRNRRTHAALMASWLAGDKGVKRCFTCGRVMTTGQQKQHRCDMESEDRQARWRAEREEVMRQKVGGEIVIVGADAPDSNSGSGGTGAAGEEKQDGRRTRWRKLRAQRDEEAKRLTASVSVGGGEAIGQTAGSRGGSHADVAEGGVQRMDDEEGDRDGQDDEDGADDDGEHDSGDTEDEDDLDDLPPLLQAQEAMDATQAVGGAVKVERGEGGPTGGDG